MQPDLRALFDVAVAAVSPATMIPNAVRLDGETLHLDTLSLDLKQYEHLYLCGSGKAAVAMASECEKILGERIDGGVIVSPENELPLQRTTYVHSTHPLPSAESVAAAEQLFTQFEKAQEGDLILFLLSGGSSALIEKPIVPVTLQEMAATTKLLLENGCSIDETNLVRKHLSMIKGGRLAQHTKAEVVVLVISDVIGDDLETIGSAPLYCDSGTYAEAAELLQQKGLTDQLPQHVRQVLEAGTRGEVGETPKQPGEHVTHLLLASNRQALEAAAEAAKKAGVNVVLEPAPLQGDVAVAAEAFCNRFETLSPGTLVLQGGETSVNVHGDGYGGRNQHFALLCLQRLGVRFGYDMVCAGTDGIDGNSDAAGAYISDRLFSQCMPQEIAAAAERFDSNSFFAAKDAEIKTGYTGTNVMDIVIAYKGEDNG